MGAHLRGFAGVFEVIQGWVGGVRGRAGAWVVLGIPLGNVKKVKKTLSGKSRKKRRGNPARATRGRFRVVVAWLGGGRAVVDLVGGGGCLGCCRAFTAGAAPLWLRRRARSARSALSPMIGTSLVLGRSCPSAYYASEASVGDGRVVSDSVRGGGCLGSCRAFTAEAAPLW